MMVWLSMSCMYVSVRTASGGTSYFGTSPQGMASRSRAPERATQACRSNGGIAVGQTYYRQRVQTSIKAAPTDDHHWWLRREHPRRMARARDTGRLQERGLKARADRRYRRRGPGGGGWRRESRPRP